MTGDAAERRAAPRKGWRQSIPRGRPRTVKVVRLDEDTPEVARAKAELRRFTEDQRFFGDVYDELLERYPEKWVAVYRKEIVGADADFGRLLKSMKARGYPLSRLAINHVTAETVNWIWEAN